MRDAQTFQRMETSLLWMWMCLLQMETHPLWVGDVSFTDGNAAARTFGRAHRHRPYHFSYGSVPQGCRRIVRRWTNTRNVCRQIVRRWTKSKKVAGKQFADGLNREKVAGKQFADGLNQEKVAGKQFADGLNRKRLPANSSPMD